MLKPRTMFSYRATDERRLFARECQALQARLVSTLGTVSTMSLLHPDNQEWSEAVKKFGTVAAQLQHAANEVADLTEGKALFASHVFAPASHHFQQDALERLGIRPSRDIESLALRQLQDFLNEEVAQQSSLSAAAPETASSVREEEEEEEEAALLAHRRQQVETAMTAQQQSVTGGATAQAAAAAVTAQLNEENVPLPWTGKQKRALAALDFDALANRINGVNHIVWQLEDISRDLLPAGDSLVESLAAKDALRGPVTAAAGAALGAASAGGGSVESAELKRKKTAMLDAMFKGHGCRPVFSSFGYS